MLCERTVITQRCHLIHTRSNTQKQDSGHAFNQFGDNVVFDEKGRYNELRIDFEALAVRIIRLHEEAKKRGYDLWRVIFDPEFQPQLFKTKYVDCLKENITFSSKHS